MGRKFRIKKRSKGQEDPVEINITPMIDMFSVLNTFLLMTAVFSMTGAARVEVPFLSSKTPPTQQELDKNPEIVVTLIVDQNEVKVEVGNSANSSGIRRETYRIDDQGLDSLQAQLYELRQRDLRFDKVTVMTETDVNYETLIKVIDACRELQKGRQPIALPPDYALPVGVAREALIPKIVLGNVIL